MMTIQIKIKNNTIKNKNNDKMISLMKIMKKIKK